ncbi:MAG: heparan-alpha-glucosaminide N-acetyltransferase domain-containing protein [Clostridiales bacterium]|nr:heparan-alpha-glucosaminide N-acetyltransferase domain-containing protein [Clostridiales bacterium]
MSSWLKKEEINTSRLYHLDLLKALAAASMILCHCVIMLGVHHNGYENDFLYWFGDIVLGDYIAVAHAFMFAMGVGFVFTKANAPGDYVKRGAKTFLLGYMLNFFRYGIYALIEGVISGEFEPQTLEALFGPDILQFAGLAMILTGVLKRLGLNEAHIFLLSLVMSAAGSFLVLIDTGSYVGNLLLGHVITTTEDTSRFALLNWYVFAASGMLFGAAVRRTENTDLFYKRLLVISGVVSAVYLALTFRFRELFLTEHRFYYAASTVEAAGLLCTDLFLLSVFHGMIRRFGVSKFRTEIEMSRNLTAIYMIQWCVIGFTDSIFGYVLEYSFPYYVIYPFGFALIIVSFDLARLWKNRKNRKTPVFN